MLALGQVNQGFPRQVRIIKTDDFSSVFSFRKRITGDFLVIHYQPNQLNTLRLGVVVAKKFTRLSVERNYMKRVLRELFRLQLPLFRVQGAEEPEMIPTIAFNSGLDIIIRTQKTFTQHDFIVVKQEFNELFNRLHKQSLKLNMSAPEQSVAVKAEP